MDTPAVVALRLEAALAQATQAVRLTLSDQTTRTLAHASVDSVVLTTDPQTNHPVLRVQASDQRITLPIPASPAVVKLLEVNPQIPMQVQVTDSGDVILTAQVQRPEPTLVVLRGTVTTPSQTQPTSQMPQPAQVPKANPLPQAVSALTQITPERVTGVLSNQGPLPSGSPVAMEVQSNTWKPMQVARSVAESIQSVGGGVKPVLIPDLSPAIPRPMAPDAMPAQVPIRQPIANELGLKAGQVVQALIATSKGQQQMQLGQQQLPLPQGMQLPQGEVTMRVVQTAQGLALSPQPTSAQSLPIGQPIATELGLKAGQVVQVQIANTQGQQQMQLGQQQLPLPQGLQLPQGEVTMRVVQTAQGLALSPQLPAASPQAGQAAAISGLSAALASVIAKPSARPATQSLFAAGALEGQLASAGLAKDAQLLQTNRLSSQNLSGQQIAAAVKFGSLMNEKAIAEGIGFQGGMLKPWLRQMLRLLPHQSELSVKLGDLIGELESFQLESLPQSGTRDHGLSALLLFRDQPPVELIFERHEQDDEAAEGPLWVINLHTSLESLGDVWLRSGFSGSSVELMFWAADPNTASLAKGARLDLEEALSEQGLTVKSLQIFDVPRPGHEHLNPGGLPHTDVSA